MSERVPDWYVEGAAPADVEPLAAVEQVHGGHVYLLCFASTPLAHAKHYIGATGKPIADRIKAHRGQRGSNGESLGRPAKILAALLRAGGDFVLARSWSFATTDEAFAFERRLKIQGGGAKCCPLCAPGNRKGAGKGWRKGYVAPVATPKQAAANARRRAYQQRRRDTAKAAREGQSS